jgi:hypothetical protein
MLAEFHPMPWSDFPTKCFIYLLFGGIAHVLFFFFGFFCIVVVSAPSQRLCLHLSQNLRRFTLFSLLFLPVAAIFNGVWSCTIWGQFYDSTDYVIDFLPFWPIARGIIDAPFVNERGQLLGISLFELQLIWFVFAVGTWAVTYCLYKQVLRLHGRVNAGQELLTPSR